MFILCFLDLSLSVFALFCVLYGGASGPLRCCAFLICLLFCGGAVASSLFRRLFVVVWFCLFFCLLSGVLRLLSGVFVFCLLVGLWPSPLRSCVFLICLLFAGGASAALCDPVLFYQSPVCWWALVSCPILCFLVCLFLCPVLSLWLCGALLCDFGAQPLFFDPACS